MAKQLTKRQAVEHAAVLIEQETGFPIDKRAVTNVEISPSEVSLRIGNKCLHFAYAIHNVVDCGHFEFVSDGEEPTAE
mgnify:FL=1|nr:MAG TPA: hypothetical protein [Caudoviricetes sp.]